MTTSTWWGVGLALALLIPVGALSAEEGKPAPVQKGSPAVNATPPALEDANDPLEPLNRVTSGFNTFLRTLLIDPLVDGYQAVTPDPVEKAISNAASNLNEPVTAISSFLQGDTENAGTATKRFFVNTTLGLGGTSDPASDMGMVQRKEDLGQAAGASGVDSGFYIVLPVIGPSNLRDASGDIITTIANPLPLAATAAGGVTEYSDNQDTIQEMTKGSLDSYALERNAYRQRRQFLINNGEIKADELPDIPDDEPESK
ncbi:MAG: VacJ family lipoprotein [Rhodospirillales bacterium]|nr:VacJ family lipoprotein [Rhodospirillales bacterium]